jgi:hypothetical protein
MLIDIYITGPFTFPNSSCRLIIEVSYVMFLMEKEIFWLDEQKSGITMLLSDKAT